MTQTSGIVLGALLVPVLFMLFWNDRYFSLSTPLPENIHSEADVHPGSVRAAAPVDGTEENAIDKTPTVAVDNETNNVSPVTPVLHYPVWGPFNSEWAAQGFAQRLTLATGVPIKVVSEDSGDYLVVFNYRDDAERQAIVHRIVTVIGLELE